MEAAGSSKKVINSEDHSQHLITSMYLLPYLIPKFRAFVQQSWLHNSSRILYFRKSRFDQNIHRNQTYLPILFFFFLYYPPIYIKIFQVIPSLQVFWPQFCKYFSFSLSCINYCAMESEMDIPSSPSCANLCEQMDLSLWWWLHEPAYHTATVDPGSTSPSGLHHHSAVTLLKRPAGNIQWYAMKLQCSLTTM
jgi:hypothetical protein